MLTIQSENIDRTNTTSVIREISEVAEIEEIREDLTEKGYNI